MGSLSMSFFTSAIFFCTKLSSERIQQGWRGIVPLCPSPALPQELNKIKPLTIFSALTTKYRSPLLQRTPNMAIQWMCSSDLSVLPKQYEFPFPFLNSLCSKSRMWRGNDSFHYIAVQKREQGLLGDGNRHEQALGSPSTSACTAPTHVNDQYFSEIQICIKLLNNGC